MVESVSVYLFKVLSKSASSARLPTVLLHKGVVLVPAGIFAIPCPSGTSTFLVIATWFDYKRR